MSSPIRRTVLRFRDTLSEKNAEAFASVLPLTLLIIILCSFWAPVPVSAMLGFLLGAVLLVVGMGLFSLGTDLAMTPIGREIGSAVTRTRKLWLVELVSFLVGVIVTVSEPDLQVLARQVDGVPDQLLIWAVALGVGLFLLAAMLRILFALKLKWILLGCYAAVFALTPFVPKNFLAVAFDSGGVTTGPMTVPFIMAMGVGVASLRGGGGDSDSFGLVALASVGPVLAVMILSLFFRPADGADAAALLPPPADTVALGRAFVSAFPRYLREVALALSPVVCFFLLSQIFLLHLPAREFTPILAGFAYTFAGLAVFLTGANAGFLPMGTQLGHSLASLPARWVLIPAGMLMGYFTVSAEPAVHVLARQVYEMSAGAIPPAALMTAMSAGVSVSLGLAMVRVLTGISILWFLVPGYALSLGMAFISDPLYTAIAFDSGGVASGPMTAAFLLPMATGAASALCGDGASRSFGLVALVAMAPLLAIQLLGLIYRGRGAAPAEPSPAEDETILE